MSPFNVAQTSARIERWYSSLLEPSHRCFGCAELRQSIGASMVVLHLPLLILGWERRAVWTREPRQLGEAPPGRRKRVLKVMWSPPGHKVPRPRRGRPLTDFRPIISALLGSN